MTAARTWDIRWIWAFLDRPLGGFARAAGFWSAVSGTVLSPARGEHGQFATFLPPSGDACLKLQGVFEGGGAHLDFEVSDLAAAAAYAREIGAEPVYAEEGLSVLRSPAGQPLCLTDWQGAMHPPPVAATPSGVRTRVDQVCLDIAPDVFAAEAAFWFRLTGWEVRGSSLPEFARLATPPRFPVRVLLQRRDDAGPAGAHIDVACSDIAAVRAWHEQLGARYVADGKAWTVMCDPVGGVYCLTPRSPETGLVP